MSRQTHRVVVALAAAAALMAACGRVADDPGRLSAMTFNIRFDNPDDGTDAWPHRRARVAGTIAAQAPDVLGLQEALLHQAEFLAGALPDYDWYGVGRDDGKLEGEFDPVFFRKDRFERLDAGTFWLSETPDTAGSVGWDAALTRACSWVSLRDLDNGTQLYVFNTHFDHMGERARIESAALIRHKIAAIAGGRHWVLLGDFNSAPGSAPYRGLTEPFDDMVTMIDTYAAATTTTGPDSTWNGFSAIEPGRRIDYVFADQRMQALALDILVDERDGRFSSDHQPVIATLGW